MIWQIPRTDWSANDFVIPEDMNRISGNINYLYQQAILKEDYTANDIVTIEQWNAIIQAIATLVKSIGLERQSPGLQVTADNFNDVEDIIAQMKERLDLIFNQVEANIYAGDDLYPSDFTENYVRGV